YLLEVPRIDQQHGEAALQDVVNRFPKHASGFHRHVRYALCDHPIGHRQKVPGHRAPMACLRMQATVCSMRRTQASTDCLCTSNPAQQGKTFSIIVPFSLRWRTSKCETICSACSHRSEATIWGAERCPGQTR